MPSFRDRRLVPRTPPTPQPSTPALRHSAPPPLKAAADHHPHATMLACAPSCSGRAAFGRAAPAARPIAVTLRPRTQPCRAEPLEGAPPAPPAPAPAPAAPKSAAPAPAPASSSSEAKAPLLREGQGTAIVTGAISAGLGIAYLVLVWVMDQRGGQLQPPPPEAFLP